MNNRRGASSNARRLPAEAPATGRAPSRLRPEHRPPLHEPAVEHDEGDRAEIGQYEAPGAPEEDVRDEAAEDRTADADGDREPERHRIRPGHGEPGQPAEDEPADHEQEQEFEQADAVSLMQEETWPLATGPKAPTCVAGARRDHRVMDPPIEHRDVTTIMSLLGDIQEDVRHIRMILEGENGQEAEEEREPNG
jgi:hypothetical protein